MVIATMLGINLHKEFSHPKYSFKLFGNNTGKSENPGFLALGVYSKLSVP